MRKAFILAVCLFALGGVPKVYSEGFISVNDAPSTPTAATLYKDNIIRAWVVFDGTNCTGGAGTECAISSDFNIEKVVRASTGVYEVFFETDFASTNYALSGTATGSYVELGTNYTNKVEIVTNHHATGNRQDAIHVSIMAVGAQ